ncbi:AraC-like DNA-binding protein [Kitasatospora gansuensis]|uniref:AraC-like DNA-binding protein n=1 Tax=Kitasatospora gansuensis TaxID=258050 RepID=A0A7W7SJG4_9ACTN|nr:AraC-like DNA-binding protein [Kitasatospora gansuensis]
MADGPAVAARAAAAASNRDLYGRTRRPLPRHRGGDRADLRAGRPVAPDADLGVEALARRAGRSPRHFTRALTAETGTPPGRFVDRTRLETARRLPEDTRDSVEHVAARSGYPSQEAMRRAFQRATGLSPVQYRNRF